MNVRSAVRKSCKIFNRLNRGFRCGQGAAKRPEAVRPEERAQLVADPGSNDVMLLRNCGTLTGGRNVRHAFLMAYRFENACRNQIDALSARPVVQSDDAITASVNAVAQNPQFSTGADREWQAMLRLLDRTYPGCWRAR